MTGRYRWWIGALLFLSTVINYLDRQTLSVLAPHLKTEFHWTNQDFAWIVIAFRLSYTVMQAVSGRLLDRFGTRNGLSLAVLWYSIDRGADLVRRRVRELLRPALPARRGRGRQLAGRDQGGERVVPARASADGRWRSSTAARRWAAALATVIVPVPVPALRELAPRVPDHRRARVRLADPLAAPLPSAGHASAPRRGGAGRDPRRPRAGAARARRRRRTETVPARHPAAPAARPGAPSPAAASPTRCGS